jgi:hypothetical protein
MTQTTSTVNPLIPGDGSLVLSAPIRGNFAAAYADINYLLGILGSIGGAGRLRFAITGVNFNAGGTDTPIPITLPPGISRWRVNSVSISNALGDISSATAGLFTAAGAGGQTLAANQAVTVTQAAADTNNNMQSLTLTNANTEAYTDTLIYFRVGTPQGTARTADVILEISPLT